MTPDLTSSRLTQREALALRALMEKRAIYLSHGHHIAGQALGIAIWLVWQVFSSTDDRDDAPIHTEAPDPAVKPPARPVAGKDWPDTQRDDPP